MSLKETAEKIKNWHIIAGFFVFVITSTSSGVFFSLNYFSTKDDINNIECKYDHQSRIREIETDLIRNDLKEYKLSNEIWLLQQQENNIQDNPAAKAQNLQLKETKNLQRSKVIQSTLVYEKQLNEEKSKSCD